MKNSHLNQKLVIPIKIGITLVFLGIMYLFYSEKQKGHSIIIRQHNIELNK